MGRTIGIGNQDFETIRKEGYFYIDKTHFIREWWKNGDSVTLITRPRRFGKTLNMSMLEQFFSVNYAGRGDLFEGLSIWQEEKYRKQQGTYPVIALSFAKVKEISYSNARKKICQIITEQYNRYDFLQGSGELSDKEIEQYRRVSPEMDDYVAADSLNALSNYLMRHYGKKVIILLDEYDTPMQEAYVEGYWDELAAFTRGLFNATFKTNPYLERALMTGITRVNAVSKETVESMFSDLNNLEVVTTTSEKYADSFGFTEGEVFAALDEYGLAQQKQQVRDWYDGFTFGSRRDIYNPWSIINFLDKKKVGAYWANTSSNRLASKLLMESSADTKKTFEDLLAGRVLETQFDEQIVYNQLSTKKNALWSLLLGDVEAMNVYMNRVTGEIFSYFDTGKSPESEPEKFYHGFVLGLMVELSERYTVTSNRESGFGRYDVMLEPRNSSRDDAIILEFKVQSAKEPELSDTVASALRQIEERDYQAALTAKGIPAQRVRKYGFAFCGKKVLIGAAGK